MEDQDQLVSVIVVAYNSQQYILETLESILGQSYENIELIITDDASKDNTVKICNDWLVLHRSRFVRSELISVENNTGIAANCNRGLLHARGAWVKFIAGDDALLKDCIKDNLDVVNKNEHIYLLQSNCVYYADHFSDQCYIGISNLQERYFFQDGTTAKEQYNLLLVRNRIVAPALFINRSKLNEVGGFDERLKLREDWPLWIKFTEQGYKVYFFDKSTVKYRRAETSIQKGSYSFMSERFAREALLLHRLYLKGRISKTTSLRYKAYFNAIIALNRVGLNSDRAISALLFKGASVLRP